jgi:hypothetical protein
MSGRHVSSTGRRMANVFKEGLKSAPGDLAGHKPGYLGATGERARIGSPVIEAQAIGYAPQRPPQSCGRPRVRVRAGGGA